MVEKINAMIVTSPDKYLERRFIIAMIALLSAIAALFTIIIVNPEAADGSLLTGFGVVIGTILGAYYTSGMADRHIATRGEK